MPKVVIVPGMFMVDNNKIHDGMGFGAQLVPTPRDPNTFIHNSYPTAFMYNPLSDYMAWHGMNDVPWVYANVFIPNLKNAFTSLNELGNYLEVNVEDVVLVQRLSPDSWTLYFKKTEDKSVFDKFIRITTPTYVRLENWPKEMTRDEWAEQMNEVTEWCKTTLQDKHTIGQSYRTLYGSFKSECDAAMFKLKWTSA